MKKVAISGYFDPIHVGHIEYINNAKKLGDWLIVIVNNNKQCALKKGKHFMDENDRVLIVKNIKFVDEVFLSIDDDKTVCKSLKTVNPDVFANGYPDIDSAYFIDLQWFVSGCEISLFIKISIIRQINCF